MARTEIPIRTITTAGYTPAAQTAGDVANGNVVKNNSGRVWLEATNTGGSTYTLTVVTPGQVGGNEIADKIYSLTAAAVLRIGPFSQATYGNDIEFNVQNASVTVAAYQLAA